MLQNLNEDSKNEFWALYDPGKKILDPKNFLVKVERKMSRNTIFMEQQGTIHEKQDRQSC